MPPHRQTISFLKQRFADVGITLRTRHGQNFLIDLNLLHLLVDTAQVDSDDVVLEVGTGTGSLTALIAAQAAAVVTVEIDPQLHQLASEELIDFENVTLLQQDVLKNKNHLDPRVLELIAARMAESPGRRLKLVANLPYSVATPLISNLLACPRPPESMIVTIQKEVADRLVAGPSTSDYGALSVWVQSQCRAEIVRLMPPEVFWPRPKVHSAIVKITLEPERRTRISDLAFFHGFIRSVFSHRRKFLRSVLIGALKDRLTKPDVDAIFADRALSPQIRAEQLDVETILALSEAVRLRLEQPTPGCKSRFVFYTAW